MTDPLTPRLFNIDDLKTFIQMNKDPLDLKIPMADSIKIHFISQRRRILENYRNQATGMATIMQCVAPGVRLDPEFVEAQIVVREYRDWIMAELLALDGLAS
jgi:hypothetical protein